MIFLHGLLRNESFFVWGESVAREAADHTEWPYALDHSRLNNALESLGIKTVQPAKIRGWFPTAAHQAIPSSSLFGEISETDNAVLKSWSVPAAQLSPEIARQFLQIEESKIDTGFFYGTDLLYWTQALRFVFRLMIQQKFLPSLEDSMPAWTPLLTGENLQLFRELARSMPPVCRAFDGIPAVSSEKCLSDFVSYFLNQLIRISVSVPKSETSTMHDAWLRGLFDWPNPLEASSAEREALRRSIETWVEPYTRLANFDYRTAFRLEEPTAKRETWQVRYFLQKQDEPSLLIPAAHLWKQKSSARRVLKDDFDRARSNLLTELAQAGAMDPNIRMSLYREAPDQYETDSKGAWEFLESKAWILQDAGYGVLLPSWWVKKKGGVRLGLRGKAKAASPKTFSGVGKELLIDFDWKFALGDQEITYKELMALAKLKQPLVKFRGKWIALRPEDIESAINFWKTKSAESGSILDLLKLSIGATEPGGLPVEAMDAEGWVSDFLINFQEQSRYQLLPVPENFQGELRPYQERGYSWLGFMCRFGIGACLADDMGLGKTVQTIALLLSEGAPKPGKPVLIVCPTSVVGNWQRELYRFAPTLSVEVHHGGGRKKGEHFAAVLNQNDVIISSYSLLLRDYDAFGSAEWRAVILDEAQNIKNPETKQARAARSLRAGYRIALTGTPVENNIGELWSIMEFLNGGLLGTRAEFKRKYFQPIHKEGNVQAMQELKRITEPFLLRRLKSDPEIISDLPKKMEMKVFCNLTKEQASLYAAVVRDLEQELDQLEGIEKKGKVLAALMRFKQICNHPAHFLGEISPLEGRSGKLSRLTEMLEEVEAVNEKALIFTQFAEMGELLRKHLQNYFGKEALFLHGGVSRKKREQLVERFTESEDAGFFILSLKAGGTGLNLTRANHVFHFDRWWNPAVEDQATDRAYRIGQRKNVQVHKFVCVGTLEERIDELLEKKREIASEIIGAGESWLTELSTQEIRSLIALSKDAVSV